VINKGEPVLELIGLLRDWGAALIKLPRWVSKQ
jgi:hypothetical protein